MELLVDFAFWGAIRFSVGTNSLPETLVIGPKIVYYPAKV
jgi:hypothetical protein